MKLNELLEEWLETYQKDHIKRQTYVRYRCNMKNYIQNTIGLLEISCITRKNIQEFTNHMKTIISRRTHEPLSASTINTTLAVLQMALSYAVDFEYIISSPCAKIRRIPKQQTVGVKCYSVDEQIKIERWIAGKNESEYFGIIICLYTGLRIGELMALEWSDIDFAGGVMSISKTMYTSIGDDGFWHTMIDTPKTANSRREVPLPDHILARLTQLRANSKCKYVISHPDGSAVSQHNLRDKYNSMVRDLGLRKLNFHALRHTFATRAIESGMDIRTLADILGHANASITLNVYAHSMTEHKRLMMNSMRRLFPCPVADATI